MTTVQRSSSLTIEIRADLGSLAPAWDELVSRTPLPSPYLRSWWLEGVAGVRPRFVTVHDGPTFVGGLALEADRRLGIERLRAIGTDLGADHLDVVARAGCEADVVTALKGWCSRPGSRFFDVTGVNAGAWLNDVLPEALRETQFDVAPWAAIDETWIEALPQTELRHLLVRPLKRLRREGVEHRVVEVDGVAGGLERLHRLHAVQWGERSEFLPVFEPFARAASAGVRCGELELHELAVGDEVIASQAWFVVARRFSYAQGGRSLDRKWRGAGTVLMAFALEWAVRDRGCTELDLLRGDDSYKRLWANRSRPLFRLEAGTGPLGRAAMATLPAARAARDRLRRRRTTDGPEPKRGSG